MFIKKLVTVPGALTISALAAISSKMSSYSRISEEKSLLFGGHRRASSERNEEAVDLEDPYAFPFRQRNKSSRYCGRIFSPGNNASIALSSDDSNGILSEPHLQSIPLVGALLLLLRKALFFLIPSFVRSRYFPTEADKKPARIFPTAYLDALRGLAALFVYFFHFSNNVYNAMLVHGYGAPHDKPQSTDKNHNHGHGKGHGKHHKPEPTPEPFNSWIQLPIIKLIYAGPFAVSVFFIVSGFALSIKPIKLMRSQKQSELQTTLASALFRRPFRLFLPTLLSTLIYLITARLGVFDLTAKISRNQEIITGRLKHHPLPTPSLSFQVKDWLWSTSNMVDFFQWNGGEFQGFSNPFDAHLWTIPIEFRASLALFLTHLAVSRLRTSVRLGVLVFLVIYAVYRDRWEMLLFWGGCLLADLNQGVFNPSNRPKSQTLDRIRTSIFITIFTVGLYLASYPDKSGEETPGYITLTTWIPEHYSLKRRFWQGIGGLLIVFSISSTTQLSKIFSLSIPRYLGQISYALYMVHGLINKTVGYLSLWFMHKHLPEMSARRRFGFLCSLFINTVAVIWAADVVWRLIDIPCVKFAKVLEEMCLPRQKDKDDQGDGDEGRNRLPT